MGEERIVHKRIVRETELGGARGIVREKRIEEEMENCGRNMELWDRTEKCERDQEVWEKQGIVGEKGDCGSDRKNRQL